MKAATANFINAFVLIAAGLYGYFLIPAEHGSQSPTALIPAAFGIIFLVFQKGVASSNKVIAHIVVLLTLVLLAMCIWRLTLVPDWNAKKYIFLAACRKALRRGLPRRQASPPSSRLCLRSFAGGIASSIFYDTPGEASLTAMPTGKPEEEPDRGLLHYLRGLPQCTAARLASPTRSPLPQRLWLRFFANLSFQYPLIPVQRR